MAAVKWIFVALLGLGSAGALGMAFTADARRNVTQRTAPAVALREFPAMSLGGAVAAAKVAAPAKAAEPEQPTAVAAATAPEPEKAAPPVAPAPAKAVEPAKAPAPVAKAEPAPAKPAPAPAPAPEPAKPAPVAAKPAPPPPAEKPAAAPPAEGMLNLRASDTADVYLDGKKLGGSPLLGIKTKAGAHKVRFDCYDAAGNTIAGPAQTVSVKADAETDVEYPCPTE